MGLQEIVRAGGKLVRESVTIVDNNVGSGSVALGPTYNILSIATNTSCRLRLYDDIGSRDNATEIARPFGNTSVADNVALVGDFSMSAGGIYTIDPTLYGHPFNRSNYLTYYRIDNASSTTRNITINRYNLEDPGVPATAGTAYSEGNARLLTTISETLSEGQIATGSITTVGSPTVPKTFLLISASLSDNTQLARLRLYNSDVGYSSVTEVSRSFATEPTSDARLIVDMIISGSTPIYFCPKLINANLENLLVSLNELKSDITKISGENFIYYNLQNMNNTGGSVSIDVNLYIYSLED